MTDTSRVRLTVVRETTPGTTPGSPRMRTATVAGIALEHSPVYQQAALLRSDRMDADAELAGENNAGSLPFQMIFPRDLWPMSEWYRSLFQSAWNNTPQHDNDGTADSAITAVASATGVYTVTDESGSGGYAGTAYKTRHLVRATNFTSSSNNGLFRVTASGSTSVTMSPTTTAVEAVPPANARLKVVGFEGASADVTAAATGLACTSLDFTTLGLVVGQWIKIGGTGSAYRFATEACNVWGRITDIAATALTLDNLPSTWTTDAGTGKTIRVFFGDYIRNGTTEYAVSMEQGYMAQTAPTYILQAGMNAVTHELNMTSKEKVTGSFGFMGMSGSQSTTSVDASPDAEQDSAVYPIFTCSTNVGRVAEAGSALASPNFCRSMRWSFNNNARMQDAIDVSGAAGIGHGRASLSIALETYFGDNALYTKAKAGTATSLNVRLAKANSAGTYMAVIHTAPRVKLSGFPTAPAPDQDSLLSLTGTVSKDTLTSCHYQMDRLEYYEP